MIVDGTVEDARFQAITAMWGDGANLYVADSTPIRRVELATARADRYRILQAVSG